MAKLIILVSAAAAIYSSVTADRNYNVIVKGLGFNERSQSLLNNTNMQLNAYNDSATFVSGNTTLIQDIPDEAYVIVRGYQEGNDGNGYETQPSVEKKEFLCKFMAEDTLIMPELLDHSNIPDQCPIPLATYALKDLIVENENLPQQRPGREKWRFDLSLLESDKKDAALLAQASVYLELPLKSQGM